MKAVILCAGSSTRTYPLTKTRPKPMLKVANKTILEYNLDALDTLIDEVILVIGYKKDMIINLVDKIKDNYKFKISFFEQKEQKGTGHAVLILEEQIKDRFILLMGDNIHSKKDIEGCIKHDNSILVKEVSNPEMFGVVRENNNILINIIEKPQLHVSNLINCALYIFEEDIFQMLKDVRVSKRGEYEITDAIQHLSMEKDIHCIKAEEWFSIGYPWDLLEADNHYRNKENNIGKGCKINGEVVNCSIGENCIIDGNVKDSIIMDNTEIKSGSVIEDSVIGENVKFSGKAESFKNVISIVKKKPVTVKRLGTIISDNVIAEDVVIKPGCKIWPNKEIKGEIKEDIE